MQSNGLPVEVLKYDSIYTHDYADNTTWPSTADSRWTLEPAVGEAIKLTSVEVKLSEHAVMHSGGATLVEYFVAGVDTPVYVVTYNSIIDWIKRADELPSKVDINNGLDITAPLIMFRITFPRPAVLWSSTGQDLEGNMKFNKMVVRIEDDQPYKQADGTTPAELVIAKYNAEIYEDI